MITIIIISIFAELAILFVTVVYIAILRLFSPLVEKKNQKIQQEISSLIISHLTEFREKPKTLSSSLFSSYNNLLDVLEKYDLRFKDDSWEEIKRNICHHYLLRHARKKAKSWFWKRRLFAARTFALSPQIEDIKSITSLIEDRFFLVSSHAQRAAILLETEESLLPVLHKIHNESGYSFYYCRDLLMQGSQKQFGWIEQMASTTKDVAFRLTLIDLLSTKTFPLSSLDLSKDLSSKDVKRRLCSIRLLSRNPQPNSRDILLKALDDGNKEIRAEATRGLHYFPEEVCFQKLNRTLKDKEWTVRLGAGITLKKMGEKGKAILEKQDYSSHPEAHEVAKYVLQFC